MAKLTPNTTYTVNGVKISEKIIPDGTRWQDTTCSRVHTCRLFKLQQNDIGGFKYGRYGFEFVKGRV